MTEEQFFYAYKQLASEQEAHILLESGRGGNFSMAGIQPLATLQAGKDNTLLIDWRDGRQEMRTGEPLELLTSFVASYEVEEIPGIPDFQGGVMGFISYDYVRRYEKLPTIAESDLDTPDLFFYLFDEWAVFDVENELAYFMTLPESAIKPEEVAEKWLLASSLINKQQLFSRDKMVNIEEESCNREVSVTGAQFEKMVRDVQQYISNDEVIQVNLTVRQSGSLSATPLAMYEALRLVNPSPYMASMGAKDFSVVSSSPELLLKRRADELSTRPIGGTRPRGGNESEDAFYEADLLANHKETLEHNMLVELEKKDLAHVCLPGTVETNEYMVIEKYSHVMHLVSNVRGTAAKEVSNAEIVRAVFPGGTITGDPKLRTMEIIEELEPQRRGLYTGSIGWFGFTGDFELNVVIRTAFIKDKTVYIQAGAGLVAESVPKEEYVESLVKAKALWQAKAMAEQQG